jgi:DNA topoisomerase-1
MTLERGLELLAGRRAWELENGDAPKKSSRKSSKRAPTLTENTIERSGTKKKSKKRASGMSKADLNSKEHVWTI